MKEITERDYKKLVYFCELKRVQKKEAQQLQELLKKIIDPKAVICTKCKTNVIMAHKRLTRFKERVDKGEVKIIPINEEIKEYHTGFGRYDFNGVIVKGKEEAIKYLMEN